MTLGCKVNQYETIAIEGLLREQGHSLVALGDGCDICILNTCAVTEESVKKSQKAIKRMRKSEPNALIAVCGCYTELDSETAEKLGADIVSGTEDRQGFALKIVEFLTDKGSVPLSDAEEQTERQEGIPRVQAKPYTAGAEAVPLSVFEELPPGNSENRTRALLKIQDGCNNFCTYCIVPYARGRSRSLSIERITEYTTKLAEQGYREIVITGIEISSWGKDIVKQGDGSSALLQESRGTVPLLHAAIQAVNNAAPTARLRLGSLDPSIMTEELCLELSKVSNLCNHFHLSIQSGCDEILTKMGRKYTAQQVLNSIESIRNHFENCGITADMIVGFPGETDTEFEQTLEFIEKAKLSEMHIFPYSERPGTTAAKMPKQVDKTIRKERAQKAKKLANEMSLDFKQTQIGKTMEILFEQEKEGYTVGHSDNYLEIKVPEKVERNTISKVKITAIKRGALYGKIVE